MSATRRDRPPPLPDEPPPRLVTFDPDDAWGPNPLDRVPSEPDSTDEIEPTSAELEAIAADEPQPSVPVAAAVDELTARAQERVEALRGNRLTDLGNAERLVSAHGDDLRFVHQWRRWLVWDGTRWRADHTGEVSRRAKATVQAIYAEAARTESQVDRKELVAWASRSEYDARINAMLSLAESEMGIPVMPSDFDADPWLLNVPNGTIDLRTGTLREHRREDMITKVTTVPYDPDARSELWESFLEQATGGDAAKVDFLQRAIGYSYTGMTTEERLMLILGPGASGKSTFTDACRTPLGDYATVADFETFLARRPSGGPRNDIAALAGSRMVISIEVEEGRRLAEGLVKTITGGDTVRARFLYQEGFEFIPAFPLWLIANHAPSIRDDDSAIWRRIIRVPFTNVVPVGQRDPTLKSSLCDRETHSRAVLAWAVRGCLEWQRHGLAVPEGLLVATEELRAGQDPLREFFEDRCVFDPKAWTAIASLRAAYEDWCRETGRQFPIGPRPFADRLETRACRNERRTIAGARARGWVGIGLIEHGISEPATELYETD